MDKQTYVRTGEGAFDDLIPRVHSFLEKDRLDLTIDGRSVSGFRSPDARSIWIRDHSDMLRGGRYFGFDLTSAIEHFAETQSASGRIFDYFTSFPEKLPSERENWNKYVRVPVEADVEYRFVKAAYLAWQATGNDAWIARLLPHLERALEYVFAHPWYWDARHGLVKRPYTIDTWDFAYTAGSHNWLQFQVDDRTFWGIMHGDNSGYAEACEILARLHSRLESPDRARYWAQRATSIRVNLNRTCWNGRFYTHFVKLSEVDIPGVDEFAQLSLSNPMAINRGATTHEQAVEILREYRRRRETSAAFAEWFSIDPPFPAGSFGDAKLKPGVYVNGGIMPLVGGELARAAFAHGFETYGVDILRRYYDLISRRGETYLWYQPDGRPADVESSTSPEAEPTDGWGSTAMLWALIEGLAGVEDRGCGFDRVRISPRWAAADVEEAEVRVCYPVSGSSVCYKYRCDAQMLRLHVDRAPSQLELHLMLPAEHAIAGATINGRNAEWNLQQIEHTHYANLEADGNDGIALELRWGERGHDDS